MRSLFPSLLILTLPACRADEDSGSPVSSSVPWSAELPFLREEIAQPRGFLPLRSILHFHSPYSHDACDGEGYDEGQLDEQCLAELRDGLCRTRIDLAYLSDHPDYAAWHPFEDILLFREDDQAVTVAGETVANRIQCANDHQTLLMAGIEDTLMPLGLDRHAAAYGKEAHDLYNSSGQEIFDAATLAGGLVFQAHPEERDMKTLEARQDMGLTGLEIFQLHAILDPGSRQDIYGLDAFGWVQDIAPFTDEDGTAEPDLLFAAFHQELEPNLERWDHLLARGPSVGIAATDAHRNVLPMELRDGERPDGYRRNFRWFSNVLLSASGEDPADADEALAAGRLFLAFEIFGTPDGLAFWYEDAAGEPYEQGESCQGCAGGTLYLDCPQVSTNSPQDGVNEAEIKAVIFRDGESWQQGCGSFALDEPGNYRARIDILPAHLTPFFGADPEPFLHEYPWVYTNALRILD